MDSTKLTTKTKQHSPQLTSVHEQDSPAMGTLTPEVLLFYQTENELMSENKALFFYVILRGQLIFLKIPNINTCFVLNTFKCRNQILFLQPKQRNRCTGQYPLHLSLFMAPFKHLGGGDCSSQPNKMWKER